MRVTLVAHDITEGGMENVCAELIRRGSEHVDFTVVSSTLGSDLRKLARWRRVRVIQHPIPLKFIAFFLAAPQRIAREKTDLIHTVGAIVPCRADLISVHYCHAAVHGQRDRRTRSLLSQVSGWILRHLALAAERLSYRASRVRVLAAVSMSVAREITSHYPSVPVALTPNGVDTDRFAPEPQDRQKFRQLNGVRPDELVVLFVGGQWHRKGLALAMEAIAIASRQIKETVSMWVVGEGDTGRFGQIADKFGVAHKTRFFGHRSDTFLFYRSADIFVLPSQYESFGLVLLEAAASGLPIIAARTGIAEELVGANEAGILIDRVPTAVAEALIRLAGDPALRRRMGETARHRALGYTWDRSVESVLLVYRQLVLQRNARSSVPDDLTNSSVHSEENGRLSRRDA